MRRCLLVMLCCWLPLLAVAADESAPSAPAAQAVPPTDSPGAVAPARTASRPVAIGSGVSEAKPFTVLLGLACILAIIFGAAWLIRRMGAVTMGGQSAMKILAGLSVGPRERVLLIEAGDKQILIGVASGSVTHLQTFDDPIIQSGDRQPLEFAERLKTLISARTHQRGGGEA